MSPQEAAGVIAYLQANPDAARAAHEQAMSMLKQSPGMVGAMTNMLQVSPWGDHEGRGGGRVRQCRQGRRGRRLHPWAQHLDRYLDVGPAHGWLQRPA